MTKKEQSLDKEKRNIIFTFDHELFLGEKSGTPEKCMFLPYSHLKSVFNEFSVEKAVFFLDTTYLIRLDKEIKSGLVAVNLMDKIQTHVRELLEDGHYIFPHIHPHWLNAELKENGMWKLTNFSKYCFKNCSSEEMEVIWDKSIKILNRFGVNDFHKIDAFRAGGWGIQPFKNFKPYFEKHSLVYDFSVMPGMHGYTEAQQFDFSDVEWKAQYSFSDVVTEEDKNGSFVELPISIRRRTKDSLREKLLLKYLWKTGNRSFGDGIGAVPNKIDYTPKKIVEGVDMVSLDLINAANFGEHLQLLKDRKTIQFLSHPKMLSKHSIKMMKKFLSYASKHYSLNFDFRDVH